MTQVSGERTGDAPLRTTGSVKANRAGNGQAADQSGTKAQSGIQPKRLTDETQTAKTSSQTAETSSQTAEMSSQTAEPAEQQTAKPKQETRITKVRTKAK